MKLFLITALLATATADVSHLSRTYLPALQSHSSNSPSQNYLPPVQTYSQPAIENLQPIHHQSFSAPSIQSYSAPSISYSGPIEAEKTITIQHGGHGGQGGNGGSHGGQNAAPSSEYLPPVQQTYEAPQSYAHVQQTFTNSIPSSSYQAPSIKYTNVIASAPIQHHHLQQQYSAPAVQHVQQTYSAPAQDTSSFVHSISSSGGHDIGTQYAANGGYVY